MSQTAPQAISGSVVLRRVRIQIQPSANFVLDWQIPTQLVSSRRWPTPFAYTGGVGILRNPAASYALAVNGAVLATSYTPSDIRYKKNVQNLGNALETIEKLQGVSFDWRQGEFPGIDFGSKEQQIGMIAQQVREIVPQAVREDDEGYLAVNYAQMVPLLIEAMKEMNAEIRDLKRKLDQRQ